MTESEWQNLPSLTSCLNLLRPKASQATESCAWFAVACSRRIWNLIDDLGRAAVEQRKTSPMGVLVRMNCVLLGLPAKGPEAKRHGTLRPRAPSALPEMPARSAQAGAVTLGTETENFLPRRICQGDFSTQLGVFR